uniref:Uncharacterized protein n=1 Tax=Romanomermis culicivorax TaxID=13658 RepID=A0A915J264_ROMCU
RAKSKSKKVVPYGAARYPAAKYDNQPCGTTRGRAAPPVTPINKILLDDEPSLWAVDAVGWALEQASGNAQPTPAVTGLPSMMTTGAQRLSGIAQQQPLAAAINSQTEVANSFGETLHALNDNVSIIEASLFPTATAPLTPKIGVLHEFHPWGGLVIDFPSKEPISSDNNKEDLRGDEMGVDTEDKGDT